MPSNYHGSPIDYLVKRKFPPLVLATLNRDVVASRITSSQRGELQGAVDEYRKSLLRLPPDELTVLYASELAKDEAERAAEAARAEARQPYNQPAADADFDHWCKAEHWSLDEAVALALGKAPEVVSWATVSPFVAISPFALRYSRLRDLALRATQWKKLFDPVLPIIFVHWAQSNEIDLPAELVSKVEARKGNWTDWKTLYEDAVGLIGSNSEKWKEVLEQTGKGWKEVVAKRDELLAAKGEEVAELKHTIAVLRAEQPKASPPEKSQSSRERSNMLKVIYGMASTGRYKFDPEKKRNDAVPRIKSDLELIGLRVSDDTIARYLKEGARSRGDWKEDQDQ